MIKNELRTSFRPLTMPRIRQVHFYELKASPVKSAIETIKKLAWSMEKGNLLSLLIVIRYGLSTCPKWSQYDVQWYNEIAKLLIDAYSNFYPILYFASMRKIVRAKRLTSLNLIWTFFESQKEKKFFCFPFQVCSVRCNKIKLKTLFLSHLQSFGPDEHFSFIAF